MISEYLSISTVEKLASVDKAIKYIKHKQYEKGQVLNKKDVSLNDREIKELLKILECNNE